MSVIKRSKVLRTISIAWYNREFPFAFKVLRNTRHESKYILSVKLNHSIFIAFRTRVRFASLANSHPVVRWSNLATKSLSAPNCNRPVTFNPTLLQSSNVEKAIYQSNYLLFTGEKVVYSIPTDPIHLEKLKVVEERWKARWIFELASRSSGREASYRREWISVVTIRAIIIPATFNFRGAAVHGNARE